MSKGDAAPKLPEPARRRGYPSHSRCRYAQTQAACVQSGRGSRHAHAAPRNASIRCSHPAIWFQLVKMRLTTSRPAARRLRSHPAHSLRDRARTLPANRSPAATSAPSQEPGRSRSSRRDSGDCLATRVLVVVIAQREAHGARDALTWPRRTPSGIADESFQPVVGTAFRGGERENERKGGRAASAPCRAAGDTRVCGYTHAARGWAAYRPHASIRTSDAGRNATGEWRHLCGDRPYGLPCAAHGAEHERGRGTFKSRRRCRSPT